MICSWEGSDDGFFMLEGLLKAKFSSASLCCHLLVSTYEASSVTDKDRLPYFSSLISPLVFNIIGLMGSYYLSSSLWKSAIWKKDWTCSICSQVGEGPIYKTTRECSFHRTIQNWVVWKFKSVKVCRQRTDSIWRWLHKQNQAFWKSWMTSSKIPWAIQLVTTE